MAENASICWYHGNVNSREEAERILLSDPNAPNGLFLVRNSSTSARDFVMSVLNSGEVTHYQIRRHGEDAFFSIDKSITFHGLDTLIQHYQTHGRSDEVMLDKPVVKDPPPHDTRRHGRTNLLHRATKQRNHTIVYELLKCGNRSLDAKDEHGQTAVHLASILGDEGILEMLIDKLNGNGCTKVLTCRDQVGNTPLHYACELNFPAIASILIRGGANVQIRNTGTGWVPLHQAASKGHIEIVKLLLLFGAPARPRTIANETPQILAEENGHHLVAALLKEYPLPPIKFKREEWYHGTLSRNEAVSLLRNSGSDRDPSDGRFLVRYSDKENSYVLSMMYANKPYHFPITSINLYYVIDDGPYLDSLEHVVEHYSSLSDGLPTTLQCPIKPKPNPPVPNFHPSMSLLNLTLPSSYKKKCQWNHFTTLPPKPKPRRSVDSSFDGRSPSNSLLDVPFNRSMQSIHLSLPPETQKQVFIPGENLILTTEVLGGGEFGGVVKAVYQTKSGSEMEVAVKTLRKEHVNSDNRKDFIKEAELMIRLEHHCIVKLIGLSQDADNLLMVQELVPLGSLLSFLLNNPRQASPDYELLVWASQIACGMEYLYKKKFVHRDLAARNILLATRHQAKISDFGLSRAVNDNDYYRATKGGRWPIKWYAPESYNFGTFTSASDVWGFGVTLWEMFSYGAQPFGELLGSDVIGLIDSGERLPRPAACKDEIYQMMERCWQAKPRDRPTFTELAEYFASLNNYENVRDLIPTKDISS